MKVLARSRQSQPTFNPYYRYSNILVQFIVDDFCEIFESLHNKDLSSEQLIQFLASPKSSLSRFKTHTAQYLQNCEHPLKNDKLLTVLTRQIWMNATLASDLRDNLSHKKALRLISSEISQIQLLISNLLSKYRKDKNVLLFILKKQHTLDTVFGPKFTENLLQTSTDKDKQLLCKLLQKKFIKNGFSHLITLIHQHIFVTHV